MRSSICQSMRGSLEGVASLTKTNLGGVLAREKITGWKQKRISSCVWRGAEGHAGPPPFPLYPCVLRAFFSRDAFLAKSQEINEGIFQSFQRIGARGGRAPRCGRAKETNSSVELEGGRWKKRDSSGLPLYSRYLPPFLFLLLSRPSFFLSFFLSLS